MKNLFAQSPYAESKILEEKYIRQNLKIAYNAHLILDSHINEDKRNDKINDRKSLT